MNQQEKYLPIPRDHLRDKYMISNKGNVFSITRRKIMKLDSTNIKKRIELTADGIPKNHYVHDLVAMAFIPNPNNYEHVYHIDGDKSNNNVENLEWCTLSQSVFHAQKVLNKVRPTVAVRQLDLNNNIIQEFKSIREAEEITGIGNSHITRVCKGNRQTAGGFKWEYITIIPTDDEPIGGSLPEYPNYIVTVDGKVYSKNTKRFMILTIAGDGYVTIDLRNGIKDDWYVHDLVAQVYIERIPGKNQVNHKDKNKTNNNVENLEWVTGSGNMFHHHQTKDKISTMPVIKYDFKLNEIERYDNIIIASKKNNNINKCSIRYACEGKYKTSGGYIWKYVDL